MRDMIMPPCCGNRCNYLQTNVAAIVSLGSEHKFQSRGLEVTGSIPMEAENLCLAGGGGRGRPSVLQPMLCDNKNDYVILYGLYNEYDV